MSEEKTTVAEYTRRLVLWIQALKSGEFKQGRGALCRDQHYCCLGVACEIYSRETGRGRWVDSDRGLGFFPDLGPAVKGRVETLALPPEVRDWYGLMSSEGMSRQDWREPRSLARANDSYDYTFKMIADLLWDEHQLFFNWRKKEEE